MQLDFFKQFRIRDPGPFWLQLASVGILIVAVCWFCVRTIHWPIVGDASLMHYIAFLGDHGVRPYKTVSDVNWPAAYLPDWLVMHTLGLSAMAWRLYDFAVLGVTGWAIVQIARPVCWRAGLWAALLFALIHGRDGLQQAGQRDLTIAMLLSLGVCVLLRGKPKIVDYFLFGVTVGLAGMIKPVALPFLLVAGPTLWRECRTNKSSPVLPVLVGMGGFGMPILGTVVWLLRYGALGAFIREQLIFTPFHASLERKSPGYLLQHGLSPVLPLVILWLALLIVKTWSHREKEEDGEPQAQRPTLWLSLVLGLAAYMVQGKGYPYQRYSLLAFLLVLIAIDLDALIRKPGVLRWASAAAFAAAAIGIGLPSAVMASQYGRQEAFQHSLEADLTRIASHEPAVRLNHGVQCLDSISGCTNALYEMRLVQSTGQLYDEFVFHRAGIPAVDASRAEFWVEVHAHPPEIFVLSALLFPDGPDNFQKLQAWPAFATWLNANYALVIQRAAMSPVRQGGPAVTPPGYRIYLRNDLLSGKAKIIAASDAANETDLPNQQAGCE